ncbi:hypothetical protein CYLTODRAFT_460459 [Cylindrobasidium torrendii FP15055 ss-10]|uniref:Uncharacterized protein n=1 Tax=Cylindrobasidium torrendii FP15055 ss-10 TaxID=1314674 RepID=A0A0D7ASF4_9AGAR|nr:hypothetical protein CYLTODRAFT_460459 [Cylindrobasidium torrendii FP15055 ss-10]
MDKHYDFMGAADAVGDLIENMSDRQLDHVARPEHRGLPGITAATSDGGKTWRLVKMVDGDKVEIQFIAHGVLSSVNLPPFENLPSLLGTGRTYYN